MKNKIFVLAVLLISFQQIRACDICGCGTGNFNPYMFPHLAKNFFSFSYQQRNYSTHFLENNEEINNKEYYNSLMLTGQFSPVKNLQLMLVMPFQINKQTGPEGIKSLSRPGDVVLLANYKLIDHISGKGEKMLRQTLLAGGGIKLATGDHRFNENNETQVGNSNFQAGSGSTDYLLNTFYSLRYKKIAFSTGINYKINESNKDGYQFGNRLLTVTQVKYVKDIHSFSIIPSLGIMTENMQEDKQYAAKVGRSRTGGYNTMALLGMDVNTIKWAVGVTYSASLKQNLASGQIHSEPGLNLHLSYSF